MKNLFSVSRNVLFCLFFLFFCKCNWVSEGSSEFIPIPVVQDSLYGYINKQGNVVIPFVYRYAGFFSYNGLAPAAEESGLMGFINTSGNWVIEPCFSFAYPFFYGMALVTFPDGQDAFIHSDGSLAYMIDTVFDYVNYRYNQRGLTIASCDRGKFYSVLDTSGDVLISFRGDRTRFINDTVLFVKCFGRNSAFHDYSVCDTSIFLSIYGDTLFRSYALLSVYRSDEGYVTHFLRWNKTCFLNNDFSIDTCFECDYGAFSGGIREGKISFRYNEFQKCGYVNRLGDVLIAPEYDVCYSFENGLAVVEKNGKFGFIDDRGEVILPFKYHRVIKSFYDDGFAIVRYDDNMIAFIDIYGKEFWRMPALPLYIQSIDLSSDWGDKLLGRTR